MAMSMVIITASYFASSMLCGLIGLNSRQKYRPALNALLILTSLLAFRNISDADLGITGTETIAMFVLFYISHMTCALCTEKYVLPINSRSFDWLAAYKMLFNARFIGTCREAPDIQKILSTKNDLQYAKELGVVSPDSLGERIAAHLRSGRFRFLRNRALSFLIICAVDKCYSYSYDTVLPQYFDPIDAYDMLPPKQMYFRRLSAVTVRETIIRIWLVFHWTWNSYSLYTRLHQFLAIFFVGVGLDAPSDWPSLYGSITEATSIRAFWGKFWHRLVYRSYTSFGKFVSLSVFRFPPNSILGKLFVNGFVFVLSGIVHAITLRQLGFSCGWIEEIRFYASQFLAILVETALQAAFQRLTRAYKVNGAVRSTFGYMWVFGFLFYSLPKSQFGKVFCMPE